ncbi:ribulose-phosphate 3-epimerase [Agrococcus versicolor]|uniref:Ribulose-phosphate 3-epimerase n=1 Tax=Agrococcus versicolor TaxID=501482 RepID=A0ABP5MFQ0_9MICO
MRIHPSILSADFANLERDLLAIASADAVHVDVMDGHFVPNLTLGLPVVERIGQVSPVPLDVHLMLEDADRWAPEYALPGVASVTFHAEASADPFALARTLRDAGVAAAVALKPGTDVAPFVDRIDAFDMVLVMTVEPGFGGQSFMPEVLPKLGALRRAAVDAGVEVRLQVDGGISTDTIGEAAAAGADTFVAGSAVYGHGAPAGRIQALRDVLARATTLER